MSAPYATQALAYHLSGLGSPIPSQFPYEKHPPLAGFTGRQGATPRRELIELWMERYPDSNILLRMAPDVIGIDVDDYDGKQGGASMASIVEQHGPLPWTWVSSAREAPSGIYWYRLRPWMDSDKMRDPGEHVEVIRHEHRYAVAPPSWHSGARARYVWRGVDTPMPEDTPPPSVADLGYIPVDWYVHLTQGCDCFSIARAERRRMMRRLSTRPGGQAGKVQAMADLNEAADALRLSSSGERNNMLSSLAGRFMLYDVVVGGHLDAGDVEGILTGAAVDAGLDVREVERTIRSAEDWAIREGANR